MSIKTHEAISGFIATEPRLTHTTDGVARFYSRIGIEHSRQEPDGTFTELEPTFHDMVAFRKGAEEGVGKFRKGDKFVAIGRVHEYTYEKDGQTVQAEEFIVSRFGHDIARTPYDVERAPRRTGVNREASTRGTSVFDPPNQSQQPRQAPAVGM